MLPNFADDYFEVAVYYLLQRHNSLTLYKIFKHWLHINLLHYYRFLHYNHIDLISNNWEWLHFEDAVIRLVIILKPS